MDSIQRSKHKANFTAVNNDFIRDEKLSWKAKGIIIYIMSLPDDWKLNLNELIKHAKDGRDATYNGIKELIENGYCKRVEKHDIRGLFSGCEYMISDIKEFAKNPYTEKPHTENPYTEKPQLLNTNIEETVILTEETKETPAVGGLFSDDPEFQTITVVSPAKERGTSEKLCTFEQSKFYDYKLFSAEFDKPEFKDVDIFWYYSSIADWSASAGKKKHDWIATARNWMRRDMEQGKLRKLQGSCELSEEAKEYLRDMADGL